MELLALLARLLLAGIFGVAGVMKLKDPSGSAQAMLGFGVPEAAATLLARVLPFVELIIAICLLPTMTAWYGSLGATILLCLFLSGIAFNLMKGKTPDCHCFGQLHSEPISWTLFARNAALLAAAVMILLQGKEQTNLLAVDGFRSLQIAEIINLLASVSALLLLVPIFVSLRKLMQQTTSLQDAVTAMRKVIDEDYAEPDPIERKDVNPPVEGLPVGAQAPVFLLPSLNGASTSLENLLSLGKPVLLLFVSPNCAPCRTLLPHLRVWQRDYGAMLTFALLSQGTQKEVQAKFAKYEAEHVLLQGESTVSKEFQTTWTPSAVLVDRNGKIASAVNAGETAIRALVTYAVTTAQASQQKENETPALRPQIKIGKSLFHLGDPAPRFTLPNLDGVEVSINSSERINTLLLFWNPGCGYCQAMADELIRWEARKDSALRLVFLSTGNDTDVKRESQRFRSLFLHDVDFEIAPLFGANGTPSAIMLDADGNIASTLAVGEQNIIALLGIRKIALPLFTVSPRQDSASVPTNIPETASI